MKPTKKELAMVPKSPRKKGSKAKRINAPRGVLVGWKWAKHSHWYNSKYVLVKIIIPAWADVIRNDGCDKLRTSHAVVVAAWEILPPIRDAAGKLINLHSDYKYKGIIYSNHDSNFQYNVGDVIKPKIALDNLTGRMSLNRHIDCAPGIHFFLTKKPALDRSYG